MESFPSPDWRRQLIYFLLPDRFSDGREDERPLLGADAPIDDVARVPAGWDGPLRTWYWNQWAVSGRSRFQGGTIPGITSKLGYLADLGVTALWLGPVWKQRATGVDQNCNNDGTDDPYYPVDDADRVNRTPAVDFRALQLPRDDFHGYAIQDFEDVDPRFGTTDELVELVRLAHGRGIYVIFDIMINHSGENFAYDVPGNLPTIRPPYTDPEFRCLGERYAFGAWLDRDNRPIPAGTPLDDHDDGVWPARLQDPELYNRQGSGGYDGDDTGSSTLRFRRADYRNRDFAFPDDEGPSETLDALVEIWCGWIDRTDCDGFRVDTFKHVPRWVSREFVRRIREHARARGKDDFLVMGEVGGGEPEQAVYLGLVPDVRILELAGRRNALRRLACGDPSNAATVLTPDPNEVPSQVIDATRLVMTVDDHDGLNLDRRVRIAAASDRGPDAVLPAAAFLLFGPSVACLYHGTEQALRGPVGDTKGDLNSYGPLSFGQGGDRYLREAMFGPLHPRKPGRAGRPVDGTALHAAELFDADLPGFGARGTSGFHVFDQGSIWYLGIAALATLRRAHPVLATGPIRRLTGGRVDGGRFADAVLPPTTIAWVRSDETCTAVLVVDVAPDGSPSHIIDLALPGSGVAGVGAATTFRCAERILRNAKPAGPSGSANVQTMAQTGVGYLPLGLVTPGEIRVYVT